MRIAAGMTQQALLANIQLAETRLSQTQQELSTGKKINQASDDPYGASLATTLNGQTAALDTYSRNIADAQSWAQSSDSALMNINDMGQKVRELVVQAANGTLSSSNRAAIGQQVDQLTEAIKSEANTQYNGQYLFSGTANVKPYAGGSGGDAYAGNTGQVLRTIGAGTTLPINADLSSVLGSGSGAADGKMLDTLRTISADLASNNMAGLGGADLKNLDGNLSSLSSLQSTVGATVNRLDLASSRVTDLQTSTANLLSNTQDADMAKLMLEFSTQQAGYQSAMKAGASIMQTSLLDFLH